MNTPGDLNMHFAAVGDLHVDADIGFADRVGVDLAVRLRGNVNRGFGLPVELLQVDAERAIEAKDFRPDRLAGGVGDANARQAVAVLQRPIDQNIAERVEHSRVKRHRLAIENFLAPMPRDAEEIVETSCA